MTCPLEIFLSMRPNNLYFSGKSREDPRGDENSAAADCNMLFRKMVLEIFKFKLTTSSILLDSSLSVMVTHCDFSSQTYSQTWTCKNHGYDLCFVKRSLEESNFIFCTFPLCFLQWLLCSQTWRLPSLYVVYSLFEFEFQLPANCVFSLHFRKTTLPDSLMLISTTMTSNTL